MNPNDPNQYNPQGAPNGDWFVDFQNQGAQPGQYPPNYQPGQFQQAQPDPYAQNYQGGQYPTYPQDPYAAQNYQPDPQLAQTVPTYQQPQYPQAQPDPYAAPNYQPGQFQQAQPQYSQEQYAQPQYSQEQYSQPQAQYSQEPQYPEIQDFEHTVSMMSPEQYPQGQYAQPQGQYFQAQYQQAQQGQQIQQAQQNPNAVETTPAFQDYNTQDFRQQNEAAWDEDQNSENSEKKPKKKKTLYIVIASILVFLAAAAVVFFIFIMPKLKDDDATTSSKKKKTKSTDNDIEEPYDDDDDDDEDDDDDDDDPDESTEKSLTTGASNDTVPPTTQYVSQTVTSKAQMTWEQQGSLQGQSDTDIRADFPSSTSVQLETVNFLGYIIMTAKDPADPDTADSVVYTVYQVQLSETYGASKTAKEYYWYEGFYGVYTNGNIHLHERNMVQKKQSGNGWTAHGVADLDTLRSDITSSSKYSQAEDTIDVSLIFPLYQPNEERNGFMFPHSDTELIPQDQISKLTDEELRYAINEIWARHGYIFENQEIYNYYRQYSWYQPRVSKTEWYNKGTNYYITDSIEKTNHDNLVKEREKRGGNGS